MPGNNGGSNFGSTSANPSDGTVYVISYDIPAIMRLLTPEEAAARGGRGGGGRTAAGRDSRCSSATARSAMAPIAPARRTARRWSASRRRLVRRGDSIDDHQRQGTHAAAPASPAADVDAVVAYLVAADAAWARRPGPRRRRAPVTFPPGPVVESGPAVVRPGGGGAVAAEPWPQAYPEASKRPPNATR